MKITAETDVKNLLNALKLIDKKNLPVAVAKSLNAPADAVANQAKSNAKKRLHIRREYSIKGIKQDRFAKGDNISKMFSRTVINNRYMISQEVGATIKPQSGFSNIAVPTLFSRAGNIMTIMLKQFWINNIKTDTESGGYKKFFIGVPNGLNRGIGIWYRWAGNKRLSLVRSMTKNQIIRKPVNFFLDAVRRFGTREYIIAQLESNAKKAIAETGLTSKL